MAEKMDFEKKLGKLEEIAEKMESGEMSLEDSLKSYEQAMALLKECESYMSQARLRIEKVGGGEKEEDLSDGIS